MSSLEQSSAADSTLAQSSPATAVKPHRTLSCVQCQQRKVKCDREFPCAHCVKARIQCVPASLLPRQRRRRFAERELLERLRQYEDLLRRHTIDFEPLHKVALGPERESSNAKTANGEYDKEDNDGQEGPEIGDRPSKGVTGVKVEPIYETKSFFQALNQRPRDRNDEYDSESSQEYLREADIKSAWEEVRGDHLLFVLPEPTVDLSSMHPEQIHILKLWQIYLENVDPLLKVTHGPTLQSRVIDAAGDLSAIGPSMEALLYSIYCVSILSLKDEDCRSIFKTSRKGLLSKYQFGCRQALHNCRFLRSNDRECLTAFYLYLISARPELDPYSLNSMLAIATRIAQRLGIHDESSNTKCSAFEAEMRRRLWWGLMFFDSRICELSGFKNAMLSPLWDCRVPLNVNDFDLRPEIQGVPVVRGNTTEALFAVVRSELGDASRHSDFFLDFSNPALKVLARNAQQRSSQESDGLDALEKTLEEKYLKFCNLDVPLHFMTMWATRHGLAKSRLWQHFSKCSRPSVEQTEAERDAAIANALSMIDSDTKLVSSPLIKGYLWLLDFNFPATAYIHVVQDLRRRPLCKHAAQAWEVMSANFGARVTSIGRNDGAALDGFVKLVLKAWETREMALQKIGKSAEQPQLVTWFKDRGAHLTLEPLETGSEVHQGVVSTDTDDFTMPMPMPMPLEYSDPNSLYDVGQQSSTDPRLGRYTSANEQSLADVDMGQFDWAAMDWNQMRSSSWQI